MILGFCIGLLIGFAIERIFTLISYKKKNIGLLRIDNSLEEDPVRLFLELETPISKFEKNKEVVLKVRKVNYIR